MISKTIFITLFCAFAVLLGAPSPARAAGTLSDPASGVTAEIVDHAVDVVINNGFSRTEVTQVFRNPTGTALDAIYEFPIPPDAALSAMRITVGDRVMNGEVLERDEAESIYEAQRDAGEQAGLATKDGHQNFRFSVAQIPANGTAEMTFVYYEKLAVDESVGRYVYPLEDGGTAEQFWTGNETVSGTFRFDLELKSAEPVEEVRMPNHSPQVTEHSERHFELSFTEQTSKLGQDIVFYYRFAEDQAGKLQVVPYRAPASELGTFLALYTPGIDLEPLDHGTDYVFVLDISGSMSGKFGSLVEAVVESLTSLGPSDRFRILAFDQATHDVVGTFLPATPENVAEAQSAVRALQLGGGTNLYQGLSEGFAHLDPERVVSTVLITDAEANTGIIDPLAFDRMVRESDVRVYGMMMGNNANWPLMEIIAEASGGFYAPVSNQDDIVGQVLLARNKATHEALHDVRLTVVGGGVEQATDFSLRKIYKGQQLVVFGRYAEPGTATLELSTRRSGKLETHGVSLELPSEDTDNPELERLWALETIHGLEKQHLLGLISAEEMRRRVVEVALEYQLVTDYTAMVVVDDATFEELGVERANQSRTAIEDAAMANRSSSPSPAGNYDDYDDDYYGGAMDPLLSLLGGLLALFALALGKRQRHHAA